MTIALGIYTAYAVVAVAVILLLTYTFAKEKAIYGDTGLNWTNAIVMLVFALIPGFNLVFLCVGLWEEFIKPAIQWVEKQWKKRGSNDLC